MYFPIKNIWCLIWNMIEFIGFDFGINGGWLFGKVVGSKGRKLTQKEIRDSHIPK